jgi:glycine/serine hydroxymethyltransferase
MSAELLSILPNLSIGALSIVALVYVTYLFNKNLKDQAERHAKLTADQLTNHQTMLDERELAMRRLEKDIRDNLLVQLNKNTIAFDRVIDHLEHAIRN